MTERPRWVLLDLAAVVVLVGIALLALTRTFHGWGFLLLGEAGAVLGLLVVLLTARLPGSVVVGACPSWRWCSAARSRCRPDQFGGGIPDPAIRARRAGGHVDGLGRAADHAAVGRTSTARPLCTLPARVPGSVAAVLLALRTRRVGAPAAPAGARPRGHPAAASSGGHRPPAARLVSRRLRRRGHRLAGGAGPAGRSRCRRPRSRTTAAWDAPRQRGVRAGRGRAVAVPLTVPLSADGTPVSAGTALRGREDALPDFFGLDSPLRRFRTFTDQEEGSLENVHKKVLFTVTGAPTGSRVRLVTYDRYDGQEWQPAGDTGAPAYNDTFLHLDTRVDNPFSGRRVKAQVNVSGDYKSAWVPTIGSLTSMRLLFPDPREERRAAVHLATSTAVLPNGLSRRQRLRVHRRGPAEPGRQDTSRLAGRGAGGRGPEPREGLPARRRRRPDPTDAEGLRPRRLPARPGSLQRRRRPRRAAVRGRSRLRPADGRVPAERPSGGERRAVRLRDGPAGQPCRRTGPGGGGRGAAARRQGAGRGRHAWVELRVADGSWRVLPTRDFMGRTPPSRHVAPLPRDVPSKPDEPSEDTSARPRTTARTPRSSRPEHGLGSGCGSCPWPPCSSLRWWSRWSRRCAGAGGVRGDARRTGWPGPGPSSWTTPWAWASRSGCTPPDPPRPGRWPSPGQVGSPVRPTTAFSPRRGSPGRQPSPPSGTR